MWFLSWLTLKINIASLMVVTVLPGLQFESPLSLRPLSISVHLSGLCCKPLFLTPFRFSSLGQGTGGQ